MDTTTSTIEALKSQLPLSISEHYDFGESSLPWKDAAGYRNRLKTFKPLCSSSSSSRPGSSLTVMPLLLSPIVCSRFGWMCKGGNMIKCSKCAAMICMKFHSELTPSSHKELTRIYRKKLATSHKDTCAFSMDAKRWLIMNEIESDREENGSNDTQDTTVTMVPPYLIPMSKEFFMLQDCTDISEYSSVTAKDCIGKEAERLCKALQQFDVHLSLPDQVTDRIISICGDAIGNSATRSSRQDLSRRQLQEIFRTENHDENESNLNLQCILLALFGWRLDSPEHDDEAAEGNNNQRVTCSMCLNSQLCCAISQSSPASKRQRTEGGSTSNHPPKQSFEFDLINSHRYFCPVVCGFVKKDDENGKNGTSQPCWEVILSSICRGRGVTSARNGSAENAEKDQNRKAFDGDGLLQKVRKTLRSPMLKVQGSHV